MQAVPIRFSQTLRVAFQASKPVRHGYWAHCAQHLQAAPWHSSIHKYPQARRQPRWYSNDRKELDSQVAEAKSRIDESIESRADHVDTEEPKTAQDRAGETIIHTNPEASSIVYTKTSSSASAGAPLPESHRDHSLPSSSSSRRSDISRQFAHFMDHLQSNIFVASRRLNDLTGYSGIERLKNAIEEQEAQVQANRRNLKETRTKYAATIATRSTTQREVNDLLHRKHNWSPSDLERFTSLYRSDHANEQAEHQAQSDVSAAESAYEEASTKLARTILARYHEEQIWSDKIRQMSTWGTWGLMGLNVLLFIVFQIAIEPWRRRRLVKGFEQKVQEALVAQDGRAVVSTQNTLDIPASQADHVADSIVGTIVDAVSGSTDDDSTSTAKIETDIETVTATELGESDPNTSTQEDKEDFSFPNPAVHPPPSHQSTWAHYKESLRELFSDSTVVLLSQRELTTLVIEGAVAGAALVGMVLVVLRPR